jgi:hypothetical protein
LGKRVKPKVKQTRTESFKAALGARSLIKKGAVPPEKLAAFTKFLRTEKGKEWARINMTPSKIKKGAKH